MRILALASALAAAAAAQERTPLGRTGADWFPLRAGAVWKYDRTDVTGARSPVEVICRGEAKAGRLVAFELGTRAETGGAYEYWRVDDAGVWRHGGMGDGAMPGLLGDGGGRILACPVGLETRWSWEQRLGVALLRELGLALDGTRSSVEHRAELREVSVEIEVPAGTYRTVCVQVDVQPDPAGPGQRSLYWFAAGVGLVRRETWALDANAARLVERDDLTAFRPGPESPADPIERAREYVRAHLDQWPQPPELELVAVPVGNVAVVNRFVRVRGGTGPALLRVAEGKAVPFDLTSAPDVEAFFAAESMAVHAERAPEHMEMNQFSRLYFALQASLDGAHADVPGMRSSRSSGSSGPGGTTRSGTFTSSRGDTLEMAFRNGKLEKLEFKRAQ